MISTVLNNGIFVQLIPLNEKESVSQAITAWRRKIEGKKKKSVSPSSFFVRDACHVD